MTFFCAIACRKIVLQVTDRTRIVEKLLLDFYPHGLFLPDFLFIVFAVKGYLWNFSSPPTLQKRMVRPLLV